MDPYVKLSIEPGCVTNRIHQSSTSRVDADGGRHPEWEERITMRLPHGCKRTPMVKLSVYHEQTALGETFLTLPAYVANDGHLLHSTLALAGEKSEKTGEISLSAQLVCDKPALLPVQFKVAFAEGLPVESSLEPRVSICVKDEEVCRSREAIGTHPVWNETLISTVNKTALTESTCFHIKVLSDSEVISKGKLELSPEQLFQLEADEGVSLQRRMEMSVGWLHIEVIIGGSTLNMPEELQYIRRVTIDGAVQAGELLQEASIVVKAGNSHVKSPIIASSDPGKFAWEPESALIEVGKPSAEALTRDGFKIKFASKDQIVVSSEILPVVWYDAIELTLAGVEPTISCFVELNLPGAQPMERSKGKTTFSFKQNNIRTAFEVRKGEWTSLSAKMIMRDGEGVTIAKGTVEIGRALAVSDLYRTSLDMNDSTENPQTHVTVIVKGCNEIADEKNEHLRTIEELKALFYNIDKDGNGRIDVEEYKSAARNTPALVGFELSSLDSNNDGVLEWREFEKLITQPFQSNTLGKARSVEVQPQSDRISDAESNRKIDQLEHELEQKKEELRAMTLAKQFLEQRITNRTNTNERSGLWKRAISLAQRERHESEVQEFQKVLEVQGNAAKKLQAAYRSAQPRRAFVAHQASRISGAVLIQRIVRAKQAFKKLHTSSALKRIGATRMQSVFRGYRARLAFNYKKLCTTDIQRAFRGSQDRVVAAEVRKRKRAAISIQQAFRCHLAKNKASRMKYLKEEENVAATTLQQSFRCHRAREELMARQAEARELEKENVAAIALQRVVRGASDRARIIKPLALRQEQESLAAMRIQAKVRQRIALKKVSTKRLLSLTRLDSTKIANSAGIYPVEKAFDRAEVSKLLEEELTALMALEPGESGRQSVEEIKAIRAGALDGEGRERLTGLLSRIRV